MDIIKKYEEYYLNTYGRKFNFMMYRFNLQKVYRGRPFGDDLEEKILSQVQKAENIWAPPKEYAKKNRCNEDGKSILYVTSHISAIPNELNLKINEYFIVCTFNQISDFINIPILGWKELMKMTEYNLPNIICNYFKDRDEDTRIIDNLISELFTSGRYVSGEDLYDRTIALTRLYLKNGRDGLLYPSIADNFKAINFALVPSLVSDKLKPIECNLFRFLKTNTNNSIDVELIRKGFFKQDYSINWSGKFNSRYIHYEK